MKFCAQLAGLAVLIALGSIPACAAPATVSGIVRDSAGVPQIGAQVQLLRPDLRVVTTVFTNSEGRFTISSILPGHYALKATNTSFLPSLRENLHLYSGRTLINLTLNTLYEVVQWLPAEPRTKTTPNDDWDWTLRSSANRPLLRWLENGPLVVVSDGSGRSPKLKARLMATGQAGTFGESGERITASMENTPQDSRELLAQVDFSPESDAGIESMLGFRQDLGFAGSVQSVAAVTLHPELEGVGDQGVETATMTSSETIRFGDMADAEVGATEVMAHSSSETTAQSLPYARVAWHSGNSTVHYRLASMTQAADGSGFSDAPAPRFSARGGSLLLEHGTHHEIGYEHRKGDSSMAVMAFADRLQNPVLEASARFGAEASAASQGFLFDPISGLARVAGQNFSSTGVQATVEHGLPAQSAVRVSYATGDALVMAALPGATADELAAAARPRRVQTYAVSFSGTLDGTGTRWRASYRWQPDDAVTDLAPFAMEALAPYLNLRVCQKLRSAREGSVGVEALLEVQNLLAEGYHPYLLRDGSILLFAQSQRGFRGGLAFTF